MSLDFFSVDDSQVAQCRYSAGTVPALTNCMSFEKICENCQHVSFSKTSYYRHRNACNKKMSMSDHKRHTGYQFVQDLLKAKSKESLTGKYRALSTQDRLNFSECVEIFENEKKDLSKKLEEFESFGKRVNKLKEMINDIPMFECERSTDLFGSDTNSPRIEEEEEEKEIQPAPTTLYQRVGSVMSAMSSSLPTRTASSNSTSSKDGAKKRKTKH